MTPAVALALLAALAHAAPADDDVLHDISEEQYHEMPPLFHLDDYERCLARRGVYCLGSFDLTADTHQPLYQLMQRYSSNWVEHFNHTRLHRGLCLSARCPPPARGHTDHTWFASCVNESMSSQYNLSARLYELSYCARATPERPGLSTSETALAGLGAALLALAAVCTVLDLTLHDQDMKGARWVRCWSMRGSWRELTAAPPHAPLTDLRTFDGLRVLCMMCVIIEHVVWITMHSYLVNTRLVEKMRRSVDVMLMTNSTLVVQIFFMMSSFLLAHKLLQDFSRLRAPAPFFSTYFRTMLNRFIRISPSYFVVVWFASSWWERAGSGPQWEPLVRAEAAVCRRKWWTHLLYLNNVLDKDDKCLIQTWYLAADMQLYAVSLGLTLALQRLRRGALGVLAALLAASVAGLFALAYLWHLVPTYVMHCPEFVRASYSSVASFNVLYQSPLGNVPGALAGLLLAHAHHALLRHRVALADYRWFRWASVWSVPAAAWWVVASAWWAAAGPGAAAGPPERPASAALAALERPVFALFVATALLGTMHSVPFVFSGGAVGAVVARLGGVGAAVVRRAAAAHAAQQGAGGRAPRALAARPADRDYRVVRCGVRLVPGRGAAGAARGAAGAALAAGAGPARRPLHPRRPLRPRRPQRPTTQARHVTSLDDCDDNV